MIYPRSPFCVQDRKLFPKNSTDRVQYLNIAKCPRENMQVQSAPSQKKGFPRLTIRNSFLRGLGCKGVNPVLLRRCIKHSNTRGLDSTQQIQMTKSDWATFNRRHELRRKKVENKNQSKVNECIIKTWVSGRPCLNQIVGF